jgi:hypothetical protein
MISLSLNLSCAIDVLMCFICNGEMSSILDAMYIHVIPIKCISLSDIKFVDLKRYKSKR